MPALIGGRAPEAFPRRLVTNQELNQQREAEDRQSEPLIQGIAAYLHRLWEEAKSARYACDSRYLKCLRQRKGEYSEDKINEIKKHGGSEVFMMLTSVKCRAAAAWLREIMTPTDDRPWGIEPSPMPDISAAEEDFITQQVFEEFTQRLVMEAQMAMQQGMAIDDIQMQQAAMALQDEYTSLGEQLKTEIRARIQQEAKEDAQRMEDRIADQIEEGGWRQAVNDFIEYLVTYPVAYLKGPFLLREKALSWENGRVVVKEKIKLCFSAPNPWDVYHSPGARSVQDGYLFERHKMSIKDLTRRIGAPGYDDDAIRTIIAEYGQGGLREWVNHDNERSRAEGRLYEFLNYDGLIDALEFYGDIPGSMLLDWGMKPEEVPDPAQVYPANVWMIGRYVFRAVLNDHPLGHRRYSATCWEKVPGALVGRALPEQICDSQDMCNAAARSIVNNMGIASGPQVIINDAGRLPPGEEITSLYPWKIWQFEKDKTSTTHRPPLEFYQPNPMVETLLKVFEFFSRRADEEANLPPYTYGSVEGQGGALGTASGMSMAMGAATKPIKRIIQDIDIDVIEPRIKDVWLHDMLYLDDPTIKGDVEIKARGSTVLLVKEAQQVRLQEFADRTANPIDSQLMGAEGRLKLLRKIAESLSMPGDDIVPDPNQMSLLQQIPQQQQPQQQQNPQGQSLRPDGQPAGGADSNIFLQRPAGASQPQPQAAR